MKFNLQINNIQWSKLLGKVVEKVDVKNLKKDTVTARNKHEIAPRLKNELGGFHP